MAPDIRVYVRFKDQCVFAGEEVNCIITFKNDADVQPQTPLSPDQIHSARRNSISQLASLNIRGGHASHGMQNPRIGTNVGNRGGHKATMSLMIPPGSSSEFLQQAAPASGSQRPAHKQQRSISIISGPRHHATRSPSETQPGNNMRTLSNHSRSSTVHVVSGNPNRKNDGTFANLSSEVGLQVPSRSRSRSPLTSSPSPTGSVGQSHQSTTDFKFPSDGRATVSRQASATSEDRLGKTPARDDGDTTAVSNSSVADSNRSSIEFHSLSNPSQETLMSEQVSMVSERPQFPSARIRQHYNMDPVVPKTPTTAKLLMGYAQVNASFTLDGSLVDQSHFEEVKRKGFLGGQAGGGVVGVKKARQSTGIFGGFGLNNISESIGSLMGGSDMSSVKEMKAVASSRAIPLLSTPQSLLFVDMQLAPGEERSFSFAYTLPQGLPSSYRGKAIRISYNLIIGIQIAPGGRDVQTMRHLKVPLRVFSGVNSDGEIFGHDLMQPHVVLRDSAVSRPADPEAEFSAALPVPLLGSSQSSTRDFLQYADSLLERNKRRQSSSGTLVALIEGADTDTSLAKGAISRAILLSNQVLRSAETSPNRFDIARGGLRFAVITLDRPLHRLGETVTAVIDFSEGQLPCLNIRATLETTEKVTSALAVRSAASINRVTRKVYAAHTDNTLFSQRVVICPNIPVTATPTLLTSGVNLDWSLRFEFGTAKVPPMAENEPPPALELLEEIANDEKGTIVAAVESIECETFEVVIPITVYGDVVMDREKDDQIIGLLI